MQSLFASWLAEETNAAAGPSLFEPAAADGFDVELPPEKKRDKPEPAPEKVAARLIADIPPIDPPKPAAAPSPAPEPGKRPAKLVDQYRPRSVADLIGQDWARESLETFLASPSSGAFVFSGSTGTGKTSAALALAADLGVNVDMAECGGLYQISSGEQTGESVRDAIRGLRCRPLYGSGWRVLVVNEADCMTPNAAYTWLDALENLPPMCVVIFTTNEPGKIPRRLRDRCEEVVFVGGAIVLREALQALAARVWTEQLGRSDCPDIDSFGQWSADGEASFRRLLQLMEAPVRTVRRGGEFIPVLEAVEESAKRGKKWKGAA